MTVTAYIRELIEKGLTVEQALLAAEVYEANPPLNDGRLNSKSWAIVRRAVIERDGLVCRYCGQVPNQVHIDHVHPISRGGSNDMSNLVVSCAPCNIEKSNHTLEELGWA